jgi:hypothetical protein
MNHCEATAANSIPGHEFVTDLTATDAWQLLTQLRNRLGPARKPANKQQPSPAES